jgi:hypothetical protein
MAARLRSLAEKVICDLHTGSRRLQKRASSQNDRGVTARVNVKAAIGVDQDRLRFTEEPPAMADYNPHGPTAGALQGDDYPLEYYEDGYPKLPACVERWALPAMAEAA